MPSVPWHCWLGVRKSIRPVKIEWWGVGVIICLERGADCLHMVQLMPPHPKTPSSLASFISRLVLPFWYRLTPVVLEKRPSNGCSSSSCCCCIVPLGRNFRGAVLFTCMWLIWLRCHLWSDSCGSTEPSVRWQSRFPTGRGMSVRGNWACHCK